MGNRGRYHKTSDPGAVNKWREHVARGQRVSASARRCPQCGRGAALRRITYPGGVVRVCRWCGYESGYLT